MWNSIIDNLNASHWQRRLLCFSGFSGVHILNLFRNKQLHAHTTPLIGSPRTLSRAEVPEPVPRPHPKCARKSTNPVNERRICCSCVHFLCFFHWNCCFWGFSIFIIFIVIMSAEALRWVGLSSEFWSISWEKKRHSILRVSWWVQIVFCNF